jgi:hypothetical protein
MNFIFAGETPPILDLRVPVPDAWAMKCPASDDELVRLLVLVRQKLPQTVPLTDAEMAALHVRPLKSDKAVDVEAHERAKRNAAQILKPFKCAFTAVHEFGRTDRVNRTYLCCHWYERCLDWARANYAPREPSDQFVFAAAIAQCDVPYALRSSAWGPALGFSAHGGRRAGHALITADIYGNTALIEIELPWKALLRGERSLREPEAPPELQKDPTRISPVQVRHSYTIES